MLSMRISPRPSATQVQQGVKEEFPFSPKFLILKEKKNLDALEAISSIYENVALLGDIARRLPHILVQLWKQTDQKEIIIWAIGKTEVKRL